MTTDMAADRRALRSVGLQFWVNGMVFASFVPRLPEIRDRIDIDLGRLGLLLTLGSLGGLVSSALCGHLIERFGTKWTMTGGALGMVASLPIIGFASAPITFGVGLVVMHFFDVITDVSMNMQGSWLSARRSIPVMNRLHGLWSLGTVVGGVAASAAAATVSLQTHLVAVACVLLATIAYVGPGLLAADERGAASIDEPTRRGPSRLVLLFVTMAVFAITVEMVPTDWAAIRLSEDLNQGPTRAALGFVTFTSGMVVGRFAGDLATARIGQRQLLVHASLLSAGGVALGTLVSVPAVALCGFFLAGLGAAVMFPGLYDEAAQAPGRPGAVLGAMTAGIRAGSLMLPITVGNLASRTDLSVGHSMALLAIPAAAGFAWLATRPR